MATPQLDGVPAAEWADPQAQSLEDTWLLTLFAALLGTALPWFVSSLSIDFASAFLTLLALAAVYLGLGPVTNLGSQRPALRRRALIALHVAGTILLGVLWQRSGGLQNPAFLMIFVLPVIGASSLSRGQPYATAAVAVLVVGAVMLGEAPQLRWYAAGLQVIGRWLGDLFGTSAQGGGAFPGFYAPVGYDAAVLEVFAVFIFACATAAESLGNSFERLLEHLRVARRQSAGSQEMWTELVTQLPGPAALVDAETAQILLSSQRLATYSPTGALPTEGQVLFEALQFSYSERLRELIAGQGGDVMPVVLHVGEELRVVKVNVQHLAYEGRRLALVLLEDMTAAFGLAAALDVHEHATLVIDAQSRVLAANTRARAWFPAATPGSDATESLTPQDASGTSAQDKAHWWDPGVSGRRRLHLTLARRTYVATCTAVALPAERDAIYVVAFTPLSLTANAALAGPTAAGSGGSR